MKKILDLNNKALLSGRSRSKYVEGGIWDSADGLNPFIDSDDYRGTVAMQATPDDLTGSVIADIPIAYTKDESGSTYDCYVMGLSGHFYKIDPNETITDLRSGSGNQIGSPANGMGIFMPVGGSETLLYAQEGRIGTWDLSGTYPTGWNDAAYVLSDTPTVHRPFHRLFDRLYYGNRNFVGQFSDNGDTTIAHEPEALDIDPRETVTALSDDGRYLIIGASQVVEESYNGLNSSRILFWDAGASASSWAWETSLPNEASIRAIKRVGTTNYVIGKYGIYTVSYGSHPSLLYSINEDESIAFDALNYGHVQSIAGWGDGIIFGAKGSALSKFIPSAQRIFYNPLQGYTGDIGLIIPDFLNDRLYVGTRSSKLYGFSTDTAGNNSGGSFITGYLDLEALYDVQRLDLVLPNGPAGTISIVVEGTDTVNNTTAALTINETKYPGQRYVSVPLGRNIRTQQVRLSIAFTSGSPSIYALSLWGELATP